MGYSILHLIDSLDPADGGPVEFIRSVSREHAAMGHRVSAALLTKQNGPAPEGLEIVTTEGKPHSGGYGFRTGMVAWLRKTAPQYDAIFVHGLWQFNGAAAWLALSSRDTPYYVFPHGMLDVWRASDPLRDLKKRLYWEAIQKRITRNARAMLFTSKGEMERAPRRYGAAWQDQQLIELGSAAPPNDALVQRESFLSRFPQLRSRRIILFLGRVDRKKGCELLARAFASAKTEDMYLVFAGPCADSAYRAELQKESDRIQFTGMLSGSVKWGAFRCAEVFALPSHQENFGIAVSEALSCGIPTLLSTAVDIHSTVTESGAGFADSDDLAGTERLLSKWISLDAAAREQMKLAAGRCYRDHFDIRQTAVRMISLLENK